MLSLAVRVSTYLSEIWFLNLIFNTTQCIFYLIHMSFSLPHSIQLIQVDFLYLTQILLNRVRQHHTSLHQNVYIIHLQILQSLCPITLISLFVHIQCTERQYYHQAEALVCAVSDSITRMEQALWLDWEGDNNNWIIRIPLVDKATSHFLLVFLFRLEYQNIRHISD